MIKWRDGVNVLELMKERGYTSYRLRKEKLLGERAIQRCREGRLPSLAELDTICELTGVDIGAIIEHVPSSPDGQQRPRSEATEAQTAASGPDLRREGQQPGTISEAATEAQDDDHGRPDGRGPPDMRREGQQPGMISEAAQAAQAARTAARATACPARDSWRALIHPPRHRRLRP